MTNIKQLIKKGLRSPEKVPNYLYRNFQSLSQAARLEAYRRRNAIDRQKSLIHDFIDNEEFVLVILDACRYDFFNEIYEDYLTGDLDRVWASGRWTAEYCERTWTEEYDLTYINSIPVFSDFYFELRNMDFRPSDHIEKIVHMWEHEWDSSLGTTPPEAITDEALRHANGNGPTRIVAHYAQPHVPYIGEERIEAWDSEVAANTDTDELRDLFEEGSERPTQVVLEKIRNGEVSDRQLKRAYRSNLDYVMSEVIRLVERINCPVVVTADHGEHLGENGYYLHEEDSAIVRQVPWLIVGENKVGVVTNKKDPSETHRATSYSGSKNDVEEQLRHLGYK